MAAGRARRIWMWMVAVGFLAGFGGFVADLVGKVRRGGGGALFESLRAQQLTYVGALIVVVLAPVVGTVAALMAWWRRREERDFERKFRKPPPGS